MTDFPLPPGRFGRQLILVARAWRRAVDVALSNHGLSEATALPLLTLSHHHPGGMRQGTLAAEMEIEGPSLVRLLDRLEQEGLVERRCAPDDRRAKTIHLTTQGLAMVARIDEALADVRARALDGIPATDLMATAAVIARIGQSLAGPDRIPAGPVEDR